MKDDYYKKLLAENGDRKIFHIDGFLWTPVRTKPRREKKLAEYCAGNGMIYYLPLRKSVRRYQRRSVEFYLPMFSGYVFCVLNYETYQKLFLSKALAYRLEMNEKSEEELIKELESVQIIEKTSQDAEIIVSPELVNGSKVLIRGGPFKGMNGIVERRKSKTMISINIELLGQSVSTEIDVEDLEPE